MLLAGALWVLHRELVRHHPRDIGRAISALPGAAVLLALGLTATSYAILPLYDVLALRYLDRPLRAGRALFAGFVAYAFSQTLGFPLLTGGSIRYRLYVGWGLSALEVAQLIGFSAVTMWLGALGVVGTVLAFAPAPTAGAWTLAVPAVRTLGLVLGALPLAYLLGTAWRRRPVRLAGWRVRLPSPRLAALQVVLGLLDWTVAAGVLYALLRTLAPLSFSALAASFVIAQLLGLASHVPGGLGVFESVVVLTFRDRIPSPELLGVLVIYRAVYYLAPFLAGTALLATYELRHRRAAVARLAETVWRWLPGLAPRALAAATFLAGTLLLCSGSLPAEPGRLEWLNRMVPLPLIELSHFVASVLGLGLVVLSWGVARRLDGAYHGAVGFLAAAIAAALLKGARYQEALVLGLVLAALLPARREFYRRASLLHEPLSPGWLVAIGTVVLSAAWLGVFAFRHVPYRSELWWQFTLHGDAPRFLRATVGVLAAAAAFGLARLMRPARARPASLDPGDLERAAALAAQCPRTYAWLVLLKDKSILFDTERTAFIMYGLCGRSWVAMGDPVGNEQAFPDLVWRFRELSDRYDGLTIFYQVSPEYLPLYLELGLRPLKIGEEGWVPLPSLSLEGDTRRGLRRTRRTLAAAGCRFELLPQPHPPELVQELRAISDAWLAHKRAREQGFSLGRFDPEYLANFPIAVVRREPEILAFASLRLGARRYELSPDLMRYRPEAPPGVMEYLFVELLLWGRDQGYQRFGLGMAPLAGLETRRLAPLWSRLDAFAFRHGEYFYRFQGLRQLTEKFEPVWEPRYLMIPPGWSLPRILSDIAALISRGPGGVADP